MGQGPRTRYAHHGDVDVAYQVLGDGDRDLLLYSGWAIPISCMDEQPAMARFQRRLSEFSRVIRFDTSGVGLSERGPSTGALTLEALVDDGLSVLDAVGSGRATVLAPFRHAPVAITMAASRPDRVSSLVLVNGFARMVQTEGYETGITPGAADATVQLAVESDATDQGFDVLAAMGPSVAADAAFREWWDRAGNLGATPTMARALMRLCFESDVRELLSKVEAPTLILHRRDAVVPSVSCSRYMAERIPKATYVELPGNDALFWVGETAELLEEVEEFMTGVRSGSGTERVLATVVFTDVVDSTTRAAGLGDTRWRDLLELHDDTVRKEVQRFRGRVVSTAGDGSFVTFSNPGLAIECAMALRAALRALDIEVRAGIHTGEVEVRGDDLAGLAVHIGARVMANAGPGEILVSSTVRDLVVGSSFAFVARGEHELKGVPGRWPLYALSP